MIRIPQPIEYDELHHLRDIITKPLNPESPAGNDDKCSKTYN